MAQEIEIEFKEIPDTYQLLNNQTTVLKRKVLVEKINNNLINSNRFFEFNEEQSKTGDVYLDKISNYNEGEIEKSRIIIEKKLFEKKLFLIKNKKQIKKLRNDRYKLLASYIKLENIKSSPDDTIIDITSLENIDFNKPCTQEDKLEIFKLLDHYIYQDCIDEINCEIKEKESAGADSIRLDYGRQYNPVALDIFKSFSEHQTKRLPDNYNEFIDNKLEQFFSRTLTRRVLFEKVGFPTFKVMSKYETYLKSIKEKDEFWNLKKEYRKSKELEIEQELNEIQGDLHRFLNNE